MAIQHHYIYIHFNIDPYHIFKVGLLKVATERLWENNSLPSAKLEIRAQNIIIHGSSSPNRMG